MESDATGACRRSLGLLDTAAAAVRNLDLFRHYGLYCFGKICCHDSSCLALFPQTRINMQIAPSTAAGKLMTITDNYLSIHQRTVSTLLYQAKGTRRAPPSFPYFEAVLVVTSTGYA